MASFIAFIESIPALVSLTQTFVGMWQANELKKVTDASQAKQDELNVITEKIKQAKTNDERRILLRVLNKL